MAGWLARLGAALPWAPGGETRIVQMLPLGPGARLLVVEFGGQRLLIGQARAGLVRLGEAPAPPVAAGP